MKPSIVKPSASLSEQLAFFARARQKLQVQTAWPKNQWPCPKCSVEMVSVRKGSVIIESCPECGGIFLDDGELEIIKR